MNSRDWRAFVMEYGWRCRAVELAAVLGQTEADINRVRAAGGCRRQPKPLGFAELFALWHGRDPAEADWPKPSRAPNRSYEWQSPELALLASLVGRHATTEIAAMLTARLRRLTGDEEALRSRTTVLQKMQDIGLQTSDVAGGLTLKEAAGEIGSAAIVYQAIQNKRLRARKIGRLWVIHREEWARWKASRTFPPAGYVPLADLRAPLGMHSDKLCEFAKRGHLPTAVRCNPFGTGRHSTRWGTWYIAPEVAQRIVADRRGGRPMPWHGKPDPYNLKTTWNTWQRKRHPEHCPTCKHIWGEDGAPRTFEDYARRYPPLEHGAKRHLTRKWDPGYTIAELAAKSGKGPKAIHEAIRTGALSASREGRALYVPRTDAALWMSRGAALGQHRNSWMPVLKAMRALGIDEEAMIAQIQSGELPAKLVGSGQDLVISRRAVARIRNQALGITEAEAAERLGVDRTRLRKLLDGVDWRGKARIPLSTLQAMQKRMASAPGLSLEEAAGSVGRSLTWVQARIEDGTIRVRKGRWAGRLYVTTPMLERLRKAAAVARQDRPDPARSGLSLGRAARLAGVSTSTLITWANRKEIASATTRAGMRYPIEPIKARARTYWRTCRFKRARPPAWLLDEQSLPLQENAAPDSPVVASRDTRVADTVTI